MMDIQILDKFELAEQERFELSHGYTPSDGFQDRSLQPLEYCSG